MMQFVPDAISIAAGALTANHHHHCDRAGHLDILVKIDPGHGTMSHHLNALCPGDTLDFRGPEGGISLDFSPVSLNIPEYPYRGKKRINLIAGGTGFAAMAQIIRTAFYHKQDDITIHLLYGAASPDQFSFLPLLRHKEEVHRGRFKVCTVTNGIPEDQKEQWARDPRMRIGRIDADVLKECLTPPGEVSY